MTEQQIAELKAICDAATPAPWRVDTSGLIFREVNGGLLKVGSELYYHGKYVDAMRKHDADLICAARNALPQLLDAYAALTRENAAMKQVLKNGTPICRTCKHTTFYASNTPCKHKHKCILGNMDRSGDGSYFEFDTDRFAADESEG